jgi:hypothetical protein
MGIKAQQYGLTPDLIGSGFQPLNNLLMTQVYSVEHANGYHRILNGLEFLDMIVNLQKSEKVRGFWIKFCGRCGRFSKVEIIIHRMMGSYE